MRYVRYHFLALLLSLCILFSLSACSVSVNFSPVSLSATPPRAQVASSSSNQPVPLNLGIPQAALQTPAGADLTSTTLMHVVISFTLDAALLQRFAANPKVQAGQNIHVASLAQQVGITDEVYKQMQAFFGGPGITLHLHTLRTSMTLEGQAGALARQLHTQFVYHTYQDQLFYFPSPTILLPASLAPHIQAISGLDSYSQYQSTASVNLHPLTGHLRQDNACVNINDVLTPQQISQAYGLTSLYQKGWTGQGATIILPEFAAFSKKDVQFYMNCAGFRGQLQVVNVDNTPPTRVSEEADLDIEMVAGLVPDAKIVVYQTGSGNSDANFWQKFQDVLSKISDDYSSHSQPVMVSISWGNTEGFLTYNMLKGLDATLATLTAVEHISVFTASGDCGAYDSRDYPNTLNVGFPGSDPYVVSVGGTFLYVDDAGNRTREVAWDEDPHKHPGCDNQWGSGGGLSSVFQRPSWQQGYPGIQNTYSNGHRQVPDVAASAYYDSVYIDGEWYYSGGTSAAAPIWAAGYALVEQGLVQNTGYYVAGPGVLYTLARQYGNAKPFYDVQKGNNLYYPATPGWDFATGLGTPNMNGIYTGLAQFIQNT